MMIRTKRDGQCGAGVTIPLVVKQDDARRLREFLDVWRDVVDQRATMPALAERIRGVIKTLDEALDNAGDAEHVTVTLPWSQAILVASIAIESLKAFPGNGAGDKETVQ